MTNTDRARKRVLQTSFVVKDIYPCIQAFLDLCDIGPWFVFEHVPMHEFRYRDAPSKIDFTVAAAYSGAMMFELVQQHDDAPSAYQDVIAARGCGFHHLAVPSYDYDRDLERYRKLGFTIVNEAAARGSRAAYIDTTAKLPGMIELTEIVPEMRAMFSEMETAAANWDGTDPIRIKKFG
jgi:hypothetical protein